MCFYHGLIRYSFLHTPSIFPSDFPKQRNLQKWHRQDIPIPKLILTKVISPKDQFVSPNLKVLYPMKPLPFLSQNETLAIIL